MTTVTVHIYKPDQDQPLCSIKAVDFDPKRDIDDKIWLVTLPNGDRAFIHVESK